MRHFEKNPRKISKKELQQLRADLRELGDLGGFVHNLETDEIVGGNQRSEAIPGILSGKLTPVITQTYDPPNAQGTVSEGYFEWEGERFKYRAVRWDAATARRANIRANKAGGVWDFDTLAQWDFDELKGWGFDADFMQHMETGAAWLGEALQAAPEPEPGDAEAQLDRAAELQEVWQVQPGELFEIGNHRLICGDCTDAATVARLMGGEKAGACITDPPWNVGWKYDTYKDDLTPEQYKVFSDNWRENSEAIGCELYFVALSMKNYKYFSLWFPMAERIFAECQNFVQHTAGFMQYAYNPILVWGESSKRSVAGQRDYYIAETSKTQMTPDKKLAKLNTATRWLPTIEYLISFVDDKCLIYEPFAGSGTTIIAAQNLNRRCYAVEISPAYCAVILQRFTDAFPGLEIRRYPVEE